MRAGQSICAEERGVACQNSHLMQRRAAHRARQVYVRASEKEKLDDLERWDRLDAHRVVKGREAVVVDRVDKGQPAPTPGRVPVNDHNLTSLVFAFSYVRDLFKQRLRLSLEVGNLPLAEGRRRKQ